MATTYNNLYLDIRQQLRKAGIEEATLEARELVCFGTNKSREELARDGGLYASPELEHRVRDLVERHLAGEPVAYLIGEWEFYGLPLDISKDVLIPRPDTEVLAEQAIGYIQTLGAVSYTHLDVYKRQAVHRLHQRPAPPPAGPPGGPGRQVHPEPPAGGAGLPGGGCRPLRGAAAGGGHQAAGPGGQAGPDRRWSAGPSRRGQAEK